MVLRIAQAGSTTGTSLSQGKAQPNLNRHPARHEPVGIAFNALLALLGEAARGIDRPLMGCLGLLGPI